MSEPRVSEPLLTGREPVDDETVKFGLLMESATAHQKLAETHLESLKRHTRDLDGVVREEIRRTLTEELGPLTLETERAARALREAQRGARIRHLGWSVGTAILCASVPCAIARWALPSRANMVALLTERDALTHAIDVLTQRGGKVELHACGEKRRLCVRVDRKAPVYGAAADYYVVEGY